MIEDVFTKMLLLSTFSDTKYDTVLALYMIPNLQYYCRLHLLTFRYLEVLHFDCMKIIGYFYF